MSINSLSSLQLKRPSEEESVSASLLKRPHPSTDPVTEKIEALIGMGWPYPLSKPQEFPESTPLEVLALTASEMDWDPIEIEKENEPVPQISLMEDMELETGQTVPAILPQQPLTASALFPCHQRKRINLDDYMKKASKYASEVDVASFFKDNELWITKDQLKKSCSALEKQGVTILLDQATIISLFISREIGNRKIPYEGRHITEEEARKDFENLCQVVDNEKARLDLQKKEEGAFFYPFPPEHPFDHSSVNNQLKGSFIPIVNQTVLGNKATDFFCQMERYKVGGKRRGPIDAWNNDNDRFVLVKNVIMHLLEEKGSLKLKNGVGTNATFYHQLLMSTPYSCQFRAIALPMQIDILVKYDPRLTQHNWRVLDLTGGWCNRLLGALSDRRITHYVYNDTNPAMIPLADKVNRAYNRYGTKVLILNKKAETLKSEDLQGEGFDPAMQFSLMFTSMPFFNVHEYKGEETSTQYCARKGTKRDLGKNFQSWLKNFLFESLDRADALLEPGGFIAINMDDVRDGSSEKTIKNLKTPQISPAKYLSQSRGEGTSRIVPAKSGEKKITVVFAINDNLNRYMQDKGYEWIGVVGYEIAKARIRVKKGGAKTMEPIWVWRKPKVEKM